MILHTIFEALAYSVGFAVYRMQRAATGDAVDEATRWTVIAAAAVGAVAGSKLLAWAENPAMTLASWRDPAYLMGVKTIVGGLLGGLAAVEMTKWWIGERRSTGDLFVVPLCVGMAIGRVGCFLAGPADHTWGRATASVLGVDGGDGVRRLCLPLYEIVFLALFAVVAWTLLARRGRQGDVFRTLMIGYALWRLVVDGLKDDPRFGGLTTIQWACVATVAYYLRDLPRLSRWWTSAQVVTA